MVDKVDTSYNKERTSIKEDLKYIIQNTLEKGEVSVLDLIDGKPGLDTDKGLYRVKGGLVIDKVQYRAGTGRNIVKTVGLYVAKLAYDTDDQGNTVINEIDHLYVTKDEVLDLAGEFGLVNGYIKTTIRKKTGERTHHVQPYPSIKESYTQDDRIVQVYEIDDQGYKVRPFNLLINEEQCSYMMWQELQADYESRRSRDNKRFKGESRDAIKRINQLKGDIKVRRLGVINPFR